VWYLAAALQFIGHQLDGLDGIQARRTGMSTPTGELFDHGIDSMVCALQVMATASALGHAPPLFALQMFLCVTTSFFFSHLEKYNVGALAPGVWGFRGRFSTHVGAAGQLFLPWSYDVSQLGIAVVFLITGMMGQAFWHAPFPLTATFSIVLVDLFGYSVMLGAVTALPSAYVGLALLRWVGSRTRVMCVCVFYVFCCFLGSTASTVLSGQARRKRR
jgi:ethanolaminephosphotransferase